MKKLNTAILFVFLSVTAFSQMPKKEMTEKIALNEMEGAKGLIHYRGSAATANYNIVYDRCFWTIDPSVRFISGHVNTFFFPLDTGLTSVTLDLSDTLTVDSVIYEGSQATFSHLHNQLVINFPATLNLSTEYNADVYYHGVPNSSGFGSFMLRKHGADSIPALWTLSEPYGASDWWPCKNSLSDKIDSIDIFVTTPSQYRDASNGLLVAETVTGNFTTYHWEHRYPIATYLVAINVSIFSVYSDYSIFQGDTLPILNYVWNEDSVVARSLSASLLNPIQIYDSLFGLYPFAKEKYGHAEFGWGNGGGMEHQTMSYVGDFDFELLVHECAHQWFGDKVTLKSWRDIFLNEGFAVYCTDLCYQYLANGQWWPIWKRNQVGFTTSKPGGSIWVDDTNSVSRIFDPRTTYAKGGYFLHQLRYQIGDSAFFTGIRSYINDTALTYRLANINDLKKHLELSSGKNLTKYFAQWYYGEGFPSYFAEWSQNQNNEVNVMLGQAQSVSSSGFFELLVPIELKNSTRDTIVTVDHTFSGEQFTFPLSFHADSLIIDPDLRLISANNIAVFVNVPEHYADGDIALFPNPSCGEFNLSFHSKTNAVRAVEVYDLIGRKLFTLNPELKPFQTSIQLSFPSLADGNYFIKIFTDKGASIKKWTKVQ